MPPPPDDDRAVDDASQALSELSTNVNDFLRMQAKVGIPSLVERLPRASEDPHARYFFARGPNLGVFEIGEDLAQGAEVGIRVPDHRSDRPVTLPNIRRHVLIMTGASDIEPVAQLPPEHPRETSGWGGGQRALTSSEHVRV